MVPSVSSTYLPIFALISRETVLQGVLMVTSAYLDSLYPDSDLGSSYLRTHGVLGVDGSTKTWMILFPTVQLRLEVVCLFSHSFQNVSFLVCEFGDGFLTDGPHPWVHPFKVLIMLDNAGVMVKQREQVSRIAYE